LPVFCCAEAEWSADEEKGAEEDEDPGSDVFHGFLGGDGAVIGFEKLGSRKIKDRRRISRKTIRGGK
jgi:hypothetical protein